MEEGEHLGCVPAGSEDDEEVGWGAALTGKGWSGFAELEAGEGADEAKIEDC